MLLLAIVFATIQASALESHAVAKTSASAVKFANMEVRRKVRERSGDNVPRYPSGRIAPYDIHGNEWCVSFLTFMWHRAGYRAFQRTAPNRMRSRSGVTVAVQVKSLTRWARTTGRFRRTPRPGYGIVYRSSSGWHIGMVSRVRKVGSPKRVVRTVATETIEGNSSDRVRKWRGPALKRRLKNVVGYIRP